MFSRVNHREVDLNARASEKPFELTHRRISSENQAFFQPEHFSCNNLSGNKRQLFPDTGSYNRLLSVEKAGDIITKKLKVYEIVQRILQLCHEVIPFASGNIVLNRDGKWRAVRKKTRAQFETVFKALDDRGLVEGRLAKQASDIISVRELGLNESSMESGRILFFPMVLESKGMGVCLLYVSDGDFSTADIEAIKIIVRQATLALHYQQIRRELDKKENIISDLKKWFAHSTKMAIVGEIARGLTHEINNPLQIILGKIQMAAIETGTQEALKHIESQTLHIASLVRSFSDISNNRRSDRLKGVELNSLIKNTMAVISEQMERKGITIHYFFQNESNTIHADCGYLRPLILNTVLEAWKRMPSGGELFISTSIEGNDVIRIEFRDTAPKIEKASGATVTSHDFETAGYSEIANELLAEEIGANIEYSNGKDSKGNRIVLRIASKG